jgi:hypothetical protein
MTVTTTDSEPAITAVPASKAAGHARGLPVVDRAGVVVRQLGPAVLCAVWWSSYCCWLPSTVSGRGSAPRPVRDLVPDLGRGQPGRPFGGDRPGHGRRPGHPAPAGPGRAASSPPRRRRTGSGDARQQAGQAVNARGNPQHLHRHPGRARHGTTLNAQGPNCSASKGWRPASRPIRRNSFACSN